MFLPHSSRIVIFTEVRVRVEGERFASIVSHSSKSDDECSLIAPSQFVRMGIPPAHHLNSVLEAGDSL